MDVYIISRITSTVFHASPVGAQTSIRAAASDKSDQYRIISDNMKISLTGMSTLDLEISYTGQASEFADAGDSVFVLGDESYLFQISQIEIDYDRKIISITADDYMDFFADNPIATRTETQAAETFSALVRKYVFGDVVGIDETSGTAALEISDSTSRADVMNNIADAFGVWWRPRYSIQNHRNGSTVSMIIDALKIGNGAAADAVATGKKGHLLTLGDEISNLRKTQDEEGVSYECDCTVELTLGDLYTIQNFDEQLYITLYCTGFEKSEIAGTYKPTFGTGKIPNAFIITARNA